MSHINKEGYIERKHNAIWLVRHTGREGAQITTGNISVPKKYVGKRIKIKVTIEEVT